MAHSMNSAYSDGSSQILWEDGERVFRRDWRLDDNGKRRSVLVVLPAASHPSGSSLDRLTHEYELKDELDTAWAVRPLELVRDAGRTMLVLEDAGGKPLDRLLGLPMEVGPFLRLAIVVAAALGKLHQCGLVHKDIKPTNILLNEATGEVRLCGFGIASRLARERQSPHPPETIAGTLAYMAPEQTGRMNRSIDSRSDLYALGVTLYQMLTGSLPFTAADPMEWVHCHVARKPLPPSERLAKIPVPISAIIMKLLAKPAEERYQTARGLEHDLRRCLADWEARYGIDGFVLGQYDTPDSLLIPEKLYGREREIEILRAAFDRVVKSGTAELVLVSGYSGIGKSSVVGELHKELASTRGFFSAGKFDEYKRNAPYATVAQAFQRLVQQILGNSDAELRQWRGALQEALGPNGQLIVNLVPQLALIIGEQAPVPDLPPQDQQARFQLVFRRFLSVFAKPEHPLALFLDDLQWLDSATLDLIEHLLAHPDVRHLLLIGAYRDNEVGPAHPLARTLARIRDAGGRVQETVLVPLRVDDVARLLADALQTEAGRVRPLADLVIEKTAGNPFFTIQFLMTLAEEALLAFDPDITAWSWDLPRIRAKGFTDNVADFMAAKLSRLNQASQSVLKRLACLGNTATTATLALLQQANETDIHATLWDAVRSGLVLRSDGAYTFFHDRIREAAYGLIPEHERATAHLRIGRVLAVGTPMEEIEENIFELVNQFDRGATLITEHSEREEVARLNLIAGKRAKAATAYDAALRYFSAGRALLSERGWEYSYRFTFDLELNCAECEYLTGELPSAEERLAMLSIRAQNTIDSAAVTCVRINLYTTLDQSDNAVQVGLKYLCRIDGKWSAHPTAEDVRRDYDRLWQRLGAGSIEALVDLPPMRDPDRCATMDVLTVLTSPALFTDLNLFRLIVSGMATLSLEYGNIDGSCLAYVWLGSVLGTHFGEYQRGSRFARIGLNLVEKRGLDRYRGRVYLVYAVHVAHWTQPLHISHAFLGRAFDAALVAGDLSYAAYSRIDVITNRIAAGDSLGELERVANNGLEFARKVRFGLVSDCITGQLRLIRMLRGLTLDFKSFSDAEFEESHFERHLENNPQLAIGACYYWIRRLQASIYVFDVPSAIAAVSKVALLLWTIPTQFELAEYHFYGALARAAHCDLGLPEERCHHLEALAVHHRQLTVWAENCPTTFANRAALVGAEIARLEGRELDAMRLYEEAIRLSREHGFIQNEGLAHEHAARFCAARGFQTIAEAYQRNARRCYLSWGANGKVQQLDETHPHLGKGELVPSQIVTIGAPVEHLDLATVIRVSQAVSGEIVLEKLLKTLLRTALEHAGAERGLLICLQGGELQIDAEATARGEDVAVHVREGSASIAVALPESLIRYAIRTRDTVILDNASSQNPFSADPYIAQRRICSILCLPLINQGKLIGVLYLENNLAPRVFTSDRVAVLKVLASQAAISLENSQLYRDLEDRERKIRRLVDANIIGIFVADLEGRVIEANDAFLGMLGYTREDLVSGRLRRSELTPPEWHERDIRTLAELNSTGTVKPFEKEYFRKDGSRVPVLLGGALFREGSNEAVAFVLDLTERKRAEEALSQAQRLSHTGNWIYNATTMRFLYWSDESYRIWGFDPLQGLPSRESMWQRVHPDDRDRVLEAVQEAVRQKNNFIGEFKLLLPDGTVKWVEATSYHMFSPLGTLLEVITTTVDVTERKRALHEREKLRQLESDLAHMNRVSMMGELAASLSHEILHPIATARNNAWAGMRFLEMNPPKLDKARVALECVIKDADRAKDIVGRMRDQIKKAPPRNEQFDLNEAIDEVIGIVRSTIAKNRIVVTTHLMDELVAIRGDRVQLQQVLVNLILNAVDAMSSVEDRARELSIRTEQSQSGIFVAVHDSGPGIDPGNLERVFEAFYTTKTSGVGMGLSICQTIINHHGGRLWASANEPRGAVFQFTLPAVQEDS
ncbi:AAA family ATPase [Bradyrhizobium sp. UFLA05-112]